MSPLFEDRTRKVLELVFVDLGVRATESEIPIQKLRVKKAEEKRERELSRNLRDVAHSVKTELLPIDGRSNDATEIVLRRATLKANTPVAKVVCLGGLSLLFQESLYIKKERLSLRRFANGVRCV